MSNTVYFKKVSCDNYENINDEIKKYLENIKVLDKSTDFCNPISVVDFMKNNPLFVKWSSAQNLKVRALFVTIATETQSCGLHIDTPPARYKLSWPVMNTAGTYTRWFEPLVENPKYNIGYWKSQGFTDYNEFKEVFRLEPVRPCIIDAGIPHDVLITSSAVYPRIGIQFQLFNEPEFLN